MGVAYRVGGGEPGYIAPDPNDFQLFYSGANNGSYIDKYDRRLGTSPRGGSLSLVLLG